MENDELKIITSCQSGRLTDFSRLYDLYIKKIYGFIYYKVQHKETAEDLTSETFLKALKKIKSFDSKKGGFSTWLYQIARNAVIDYFRTKKSHIPVENIWELKDGSNIEIDFEVKEKLEKIKNYLQKLSPEQREIILLRVWQDLSYKEIAQILNKSEASCKMMFLRSIAILRKEMPLLLILMSLVLHSVER